MDVGGLVDRYFLRLLDQDEVEVDADTYEFASWLWREDRANTCALLASRGHDSDGFTLTSRPRHKDTWKPEAPFLSGRVEREPKVAVPAEVRKSYADLACAWHVEMFRYGQDRKGTNAEKSLPWAHTTSDFTHCPAPVCTEHRRILDSLEAL